MTAYKAPATTPQNLALERAYKLQNERNHDEAIALYTSIIQREFNNIQAIYNRGQCYDALGRFAEAANDYRTMLYYAPHHPKVWFKYGAMILMLHRHHEALAALEKSIDLDPLDPEAHHTLAGTLHTLSRDEEALKEWGIAHELNPDRVETAIGMAMTLLRQDAGRGRRGWELFETRRASGVTDLYPGIPLWLNQHNQPIHGKTILVRTEQGHGDTVQFLRYVYPLLGAGAIVYLETHPSMRRLVEVNFPDVKPFHPQHGDLLPEADWQTSLMSLPLAFPTPPSTDRLYLRVQPADVQTRDPRDPVTVGLCWHGGARPEDPSANAVDQRRSLNEEQSYRLLGHLQHRVRVVSLQVEDLPDVKDFYDTASIITGLDLVISVDTAVAHLAAALGKPVWLLNRFDSCWRWGNAPIADSHWYPTLRQFRQPVGMDWDTPIRDVVRALDEWLATSKEAAA
jgi:Flp pilus assembly protein TadD